MAERHRDPCLAGARPERGGRGAAGLDPLGRALALAEPEGYVRTFVAEGAPMADMLGVAAKRGITPEYVRRLLDAFGRGAGSFGPR